MRTDPSPTLYVVVALGILVVFAVALYLRHLERKRFEEYARARGWAYARSEPSLPRAFPQVEPFGRGSSRRCTNVFRYDVEGRTGYSFDYAYTQSSGAGDNRSTTTYRFHVVSTELPQPLPRLTVRPENPLDGVTKFFGSQDVQFESEEFNRAWLVRSDHLPAAHDVIHPRMMDWLMQPANRGARFVLEGTVLFTFTRGRQRLENIDSMIASVAAFREGIPAFVWQKARGEYPPSTRGEGFFSG